MYYSYLKSEIGVLEIIADENYLLQVQFVDKAKKQKENSITRETKNQLEQYFAGSLDKFLVPLSTTGTDFQRDVWKSLQKIPYGETWSYGDLANSIGNPKASRAVGGANNKNKIAIIVPCHRVIGKTGSLVGYAGEIWRKEWLLNHESANSYSC